MLLLISLTKSVRVDANHSTTYGLKMYFFVVEIESFINFEYGIFILHWQMLNRV